MRENYKRAFGRKYKWRARQADLRWERTQFRKFREQHGREPGFIEMMKICYLPKLEAWIHAPNNWAKTIMRKGR